MRGLASMAVAAFLSGVAFGQVADSTPKFEVADVHASPRNPNAVFGARVRAVRCEVHNATMLDLIRTAYSVEAEKVTGGPSWLEFDRFDVAALVPN